jgi:hypothetical protein
VLRHAYPNSANREVARLELETDEAKADEQTIISKISNGEFSNPTNSHQKIKMRHQSIMKETTGECNDRGRSRSIGSAALISTLPRSP